MDAVKFSAQAAFAGGLLGLATLKGIKQGAVVAGASALLLPIAGKVSQLFVSHVSNLEIVAKNKKKYDFYRLNIITQWAVIALLIILVQKIGLLQKLPGNIDINTRDLTLISLATSGLLYSKDDQATRSTRS